MCCPGSGSFEIFDLECFYHLFFSSIQLVTGRVFEVTTKLPRRRARGPRPVSGRDGKSGGSERTAPRASSRPLTTYFWSVPASRGTSRHHSVPSTSPASTSAIVIHIYIHSKSLAPWLHIQALSADEHGHRRRRRHDQLRCQCESASARITTAIMRAATTAVATTATTSTTATTLVLLLPLLLLPLLLLLLLLLVLLILLLLSLLSMFLLLVPRNCY